MNPLFKSQRIQLGRALATVHFAAPMNPVRWIVIPAYGDTLEAAIQQAGQLFYQSHVGVLTVQVDGLSRSAAAQRLQAATGYLRKQPEALGLPVSYFGVDVGTALALQAAGGANDIASVLSWNGRPELAWAHLGTVKTPVLLMVDENQNWLRYWANQVVHQTLRPASLFRPVSGPADMASFALQWMDQSQHRVYPLSGVSLPRKLATGVTALALFASLATATQVNATAQTGAAATTAAQGADSDPFSDGVVVGAENISGDTQFNASYRGTGSPKDPSPQEIALGIGDVAGDGIQPLATGSVKLIDAGHLKWMANTNITFSTSSSASGGMSEASFTTGVTATTVNGGTTMSTLTDAFDGYNSLMINGALPVSAGSSDVIYNKNGGVTLDCSGRQIVYAPQVVGDLTVQRKVYVPADYEFARWANIYTNNGADPITITTGTSNNLGSDSNTLIVTSSSGDASATVDDLWVTTMQNYSGSTSSDLRLGHVMQGASPQVGVSIINFVNGDDNPYWGYELTIQPGETVVILNYATGQPSKTDAAEMSAWLAGLPDPTLTCLSDAELGAVVNFNVPTDIELSATGPTAQVDAGSTLTYTITTTNNGPGQATGATVTSTLPAGAAFVSGSGTGWTVQEVGGLITATYSDLLASGASASFELQITAPSTAGEMDLSVSATTYNADTDLTNNQDTVTTTVIGRIFLPLVNHQ